MFSITVAIGSSGWQLMFRDKTTAEAALGKLRTTDTFGSQVSITDDFGQTLEAARSSILGFIYEDMELSKMAHVERALSHARLQSLTQKMAEADPALRHSMMNRGQGPAMVSPMGLNGRG